MYLDTSGHISTFKIPPFGFVLQSVQVADTANSRQSPKNILKSEFCPKQLMRQIYGLNCNVLLLWHFLLQNPCFKLSKRSHVKISPKLLCHVGRYVRSEQHFSHILCCPHDCLLLHEQCLTCGPRPVEEDKLLLPEFVFWLCFKLSLSVKIIPTKHHLPEVSSEAKYSTSSLWSLFVSSTALCPVDPRALRGLLQSS